MKKPLLLLAFNLMLLASVFAQPKRLNLNDDTALPVTLKSAEVVSSFDVVIKKSRPFTLNPIIRNHSNIALGDTLQLALFPGKEYLSVIQAKTTDVNGTTVLVAKLTGFQFAWCLISISEQAVLVSVDIPELKEKYTTRFIPQNKSQYLIQLDENKLDVLEDGHLSIGSNDRLRQSYLPNDIKRNTNSEKIDPQNNIGLKSAQLKTGVGDSAQIDILVVYTPAAKEWADTYAGSIDGTISQAMAHCNLVSENSKLGIKFNLVYSTEVDYTETGSSIIDINKLTDGSIPNVNIIRDMVSADLVILLTNTNDFGGVSWTLNDKIGNEDYGNILVCVQQACEYVTIHEIGHSLGANHSKQQTADPGPTIWSNWPENTWSAGWRWKGDDNNYYCDVMTYEQGTYFVDGISSTEVPYFSNPDISFQGQPTGDATEANNARTIRETKHVIAAYREAKHQSTPTVYTVNVHDITKNGAVSGGTVANEGDAPVTARGVIWSTNPLPTLNDNYTVNGSGTGSFISELTGLITNETYYLRTYATNEKGTGYGNQIVYIHSGGEQRDFITLWQLPTGQDKLELILESMGEVDYRWETVPAGQSGSGTFPSGLGLVKISNLPAGQTIRLNISSLNLTRYSNYINMCPILIEGPDILNLINVEQWGTAHWNNWKDAFNGSEKMNITANDLPDLSNVSNMSYMFYNCKSLTTPPNFNKWSVAAVTDMSFMFAGASKFNQNIGSWDVSGVTNMILMFYKASSFNQYIGNWNVSNITDMMGMFAEASSFNQDIGKWNVSNVTSMITAFYRDSAFNQDLGNWDVSKVICMDGLFEDATAFNQDIGRWDVSNVTDMSAMFRGARAFNQDIGKWDVSEVLDMSNMFCNTSSFNKSIGKWNVSKVRNMSRIFGWTNAYNQDIGEWDVSNVANMSGMFCAANVFNQDIGRWDVSNVGDLSSMFYGAQAFNQELGKWDLSGSKNIVNMLNHCGMDCSNYSATLIGWSANPNTPNGLNLGAQNLKFGLDAETARNNLIKNKGWTINGDINYKPGQPGFISGETNVCRGLTTYFYSIPFIDGATYYVWSLPTGATGVCTSNSIIVTFDSTAVSGEITVKGKNFCSEGPVSVLSVSVNPLPEEAGAISGDTIVCQGLNSVIYTVPEIKNATSYLWTLPTGATGTSTTNSINVYFESYVVSGNISVKGINSCGEGTGSSLPIIVNPLPTAARAISGETIVCRNQESVIYTVPEIENTTSYLWTLPNGASGTSSTNRITVDFNSTAVSGDISVKGVNSCGEGAQYSLSITVNQIPYPAEAISGETTVCQGQKSVTYMVPVIENATSFIWTLPSGATGTSNTNSNAVDFDSTAVSGDIKVVGINTCGESDESVFPITVNPLPVKASEISGETNVCMGQKSVTYSVPEIENATSYIWKLPNGITGTSTTNSITVDFDSEAVSGVITVKGINSCGEGAESVLPITVNPLSPTPSITLTDKVLLSDAIDGNQWYNQNGVIKNAINKEYEVKADGEYYVIVNRLGCSSEPSNIINVTVTGVEGLVNGKVIKVYPNPVSNELTIEIEGNSEKIGFEIINAIGQTVYRGDMVNQTTVQTGNFAPGTYLVKIYNGGAFEFSKIIKK